MTSTDDNGSNRKDDRGIWSEFNRREVAEDRKIGQIILGSLAVMALVFGLLFMFNGNISNVADRSEPVATGSTGRPSLPHPTK